MNKIAWLWCAGGLGTLLRYYAVLVCHQFFGKSFPSGTFAVNLIGCFVIGAVDAWFARHNLINSEVRLYLTAGLLGGFTTFSAFGLEAVSLFKNDQAVTAITYVVLSVLLGVACVWLGQFAVSKAAL